MKILIALSLLLIAMTNINAAELIKFSSEDGIEIAADLYMKYDENAPLIILFHQANWSRGEYNEIAPELNNLGYNCLAVDLRSGGEVNNVQNITKQNAVRAMKPTQYVDALQDMRAAINFAKNNLANGKVILWGSSYSSALALKLGGQMAVDAILSFSPGEYFTSQGKPNDYVTADAVKINVPVFITSARSEKNSWWNIYEAMVSEGKVYYLPETAGNHGSRALWSNFSDSSGYWKVVKSFLDTL